MIRELLITTGAAGLGTVAFAVLFGVPRRFYLYCLLTGACGWLVYFLLTEESPMGYGEATFAASLLVTFLSRILAKRRKCPVTVFLVSGIFPLVPGAGIYWTAYYLVTDRLQEAAQSGFSALKGVFAIVLGISIAAELPRLRRRG